MKGDEGRPRRLLSKPIPERIREARESRGFAPDDFAEVLNVSRQALAQYETGQIVPSGDVMSGIIAHTGLPLSFFTVAPSRAGEPSAPFWRSLKRMEQPHRRRITRRLQWAGDICGLVERFIELPPANLMHIDVPLSDVQDRSDEIEEVAEKLRDFWQLGRGPIRDLATTLEENGIILVRESVSCADMDAVSCWIAGRPIVLLSNEVKSGPRDLFNLAHELGHLILHSGVDVTTKNIDQIEKQANRFASAFLMPRDSFSREVLGTSLGYFLTLKERWGVAIAAMAYRCKDLKLFSESQYSYLFRQMNMRGIRRVEPLDDAFPVGRPAVLRKAMEMIVSNNVQTRGQIESALGLNMEDVESLCGLPPGYLDQRVVQIQFRRED